jgi:hypothetical protein
LFSCQQTEAFFVGILFSQLLCIHSLCQECVHYKSFVENDDGVRGWGYYYPNQAEYSCEQESKGNNYITVLIGQMSISYGLRLREVCQHEENLLY